MSDATLTALLANLDMVLWDQLLIIADRLDDLGEAELAAAYRWL